MTNLISVIIGIVALAGALVGFIPLLGWVNWFIIPMALIGLIIGMLSGATSGRNINLAVGLFAAIRLSAGGGIF